MRNFIYRLKVAYRIILGMPTIYNVKFGKSANDVNKTIARGQEVLITHCTFDPRLETNPPLYIRGERVISP